MESAEPRSVTAQLAEMQREIDALKERVGRLETGKRDKHHLIPSAAQQPRSPAGGAGPRA
jgi:uncharacterized alpha-E superfamily protein